MAELRQGLDHIVEALQTVEVEERQPERLPKVVDLMKQQTAESVVGKKGIDDFIER